MSNEQSQQPEVAVERIGLLKSLSNHMFIPGPNGTGQVVPVLRSVTFERIHPDAVLPKYAKDGDSGMDVYAVEDIIISPGETVAVGLGLRVAIPHHVFHHLGYRWEIQARPRSGVSLKTAVRVANAPGTVDNGYRGELKIILTNTAETQYQIDRERDDNTGAITSVDLEKCYSRKATDLLGNEEDQGDYDRNPAGSVIVHNGDRIAQLVFAEVVRPLEIVEGPVATDTDRGENGFGSTGVQG